MGHVVILMGSPRSQGNTARLAEALAQGAEEHHRVTVLQPAQLNISGCTGCNACFHREDHSCAMRDDMEKVYALLLEATVLVLATPLYFYGPSAQLMTLIQRLHNPIRDRFPIEKLALLAVGGNEDMEIFRPLVEMYQACRRYFQLQDGGVLTVPGVRKIGDIHGHPALDQAREMGRKL